MSSGMRYQDKKFIHINIDKHENNLITPDETCYKSSVIQGSGNQDVSNVPRKNNYEVHAVSKIGLWSKI